MAYHRYHKIDTKIVRIFNTYGPRMRLKDGRVVPAFIGEALKGEPISIFGDGSQTRSFCYVSDLIDGIYKLSQSDFHEPVNIGNPTELTIKEFAERIVRLVGSKSTLTFQPLPTDDPKQRRPDITRAWQRLGWKPVVDLETGLSKPSSGSRAGCQIATSTASVTADQRINHASPRRHRRRDRLVSAPCRGQHLGLSPVGPRLSPGGLGRLDRRGCAALQVHRRERPACAPEISANLAHWNSVVDRVRPARPRHAALRRPVAAAAGDCSASRATPNFSSTSPAISSSAKSSARRANASTSIIDPAFTQIWAEVYKCDMNFDSHDIFVSIGRHLGRKDCRAPLAGRTWLPVGVPVVLEHFTNPERGPAGRRLDDLHPLVRLSAGRIRRAMVRQQVGGVRQAGRPAAQTTEKLEIATDLHPDDPATAAFLAGRLEDRRRAAAQLRPGNVTAITSRKAGANFVWRRTATSVRAAAGSATAV